MADRVHDELAALTRRLIDAIDARDLATYRALTAESLTSFEPEAKGQRIDGLAFHEFFLAKPHKAGTSVRSEIIDLHIRLLGDSGAVACYTRITQKHEADGSFRLSHANETRVYVREHGSWKQSHFHRSEVV